MEENYLKIKVINEILIQMSNREWCGGSKMTLCPWARSYCNHTADLLYVFIYIHSGKLKNNALSKSEGIFGSSQGSSPKFWKLPIDPGKLKNIAMSKSEGIFGSSQLACNLGNSKRSFRKFLELPIDPGKLKNNAMSKSEEILGSWKIIPCQNPE